MAEPGVLLSPLADDNCRSIAALAMYCGNAAAILGQDKVMRQKLRTRMRLLLVEDEIELANGITSALSKCGIVTDHASLLADAVEMVRVNSYDGIILDRRLPDGEGLSIIPSLRRSGTDIPIIILTARNAPMERIEGLDTGADDYLGKPFLIEELLARLRAVMRRPASVVEPSINVGRLSIDPLNLTVMLGDEQVDLPRRELMVLMTLAKRKERTVSRSTLENAVYNYEEEIQSNALDAHISRLRKRLAEADAGVGIHNIRGIGYLLKQQS